jgi:hypothetical protein
VAGELNRLTVVQGPVATPVDVAVMHPDVGWDIGRFDPAPPLVGSEELDSSDPAELFVHRFSPADRAFRPAACFGFQSESRDDVS